MKNIPGLNKLIFFQSIIAMLIAIIVFAFRQPVNSDKEKKAILNVLLEEGTAFIYNDLQAISALHVQDESALRIEQGENVYRGWNAIKKLYLEHLELNKAFNTANHVTNTQNLKENVTTKVFGNTAWVYCDNIWKWDMNGKPEEMKNRQLVFMEKVNKKWKISSMAFLPISGVSKNLELSNKYHDLDPANINDILTDDFIGRNEQNRFTWNKTNHLNFHTNNPGVTDSIYHQFGQNDWVATRFNRKMNWQGKAIRFDLMQFKRIEYGRIAEIWEYFDSKQAD